MWPFGNFSSPKANVISWEQRLYSKLSVPEKYRILEQIRLELDRLYRDERPVYEECKAALKPNTWNALEENWKLWNPTPTNHVDWIGPGELKCVLKPSHPNYIECRERGFTECQYNEHGSPNFEKVTFPNSIVDVADLYDMLSVDNIQKRGGGPNSLQEIAQGRMAAKLKPAIDKWARENNCEADFWKWRDSLNLVPHEDTDCRTMRLVYRPVHEVFKHRGGVANAVTIKTHFES